MRAVGRTLWWRRLWGPALAAVALIMVDSGRAMAEPGVPVPPGELLDGRNRGALVEADRDLVVKVRLAGLWEIPAGEMAQQRSKNPRIREIGRTIAAQHVELDKLDRAAAKKLNITVPNVPNKDQQSWLAEMRDAQGTEFDQIYVDRLRAAHGKIFPAIATVRTSTRNDAVRKLAQQANQFVATHLTLLESSGIVDYGALPTAPPPAAATSAPPPAALVSSPAKNQTGGFGTPVILGVFGAALAAAVFLTRRTMPGRRRPARAYRGRR
jgi:putative membrane protein